MQSDFPERGARLGARRVIGLTGRLLRAHWPWLLILLPLLIAAPSLVSSHLPPEWPRWTRMAIGDGTNLVVRAFAYALAISLVLQERRAARQSPSLHDAVRAFGPTLAIGLILASPDLLTRYGIEALRPTMSQMAPDQITTLVGFVSVLGLVRVGVVALMMAAFCLAPAAAMAEHLRPLKALGRSLALTRGTRWPIVGLLAFWAILGFFPLEIIRFVMRRALNDGTALFGGPGGASDMAILSFAISLASGVLFIVWQVGASAMYGELRRIRETAPASRLAEVFE